MSDINGAIQSDRRAWTYAGQAAQIWINSGDIKTRAVEQFDGSNAAIDGTGTVDIHGPDLAASEPSKLTADTHSPGVGKMEDRGATVPAIAAGLRHTDMNTDALRVTAKFAQAGGLPLKERA